MGGNYASSFTTPNSTSTSLYSALLSFPWKKQAQLLQRPRASGEAVKMSQQASSSLDRIVLDLRSK
jgi:hypothetical protein